MVCLAEWHARPSIRSGQTEVPRLNVGLDTCNIWGPIVLNMTAKLDFKIQGMEKKTMLHLYNLSINMI